MTALSLADIQYNAPWRLSDTPTKYLNISATDNGSCSAVVLKDEAEYVAPQDIQGSAFPVQGDKN